MRAKVRVGLVGLGSNGSSFAEIYRGHPQVELVAVADANPARAEAAEGLGAVFYGSYDELVLLPELDVVSVHLPDRLHADASLKALQAGKHVFVEKPMATTIGDCHKMIDAMDRTGLLVGVGQVLRTRPLYKRIKEIVDAGTLGTIYYCEGDYMVDELNRPELATKVGPTYSLQGFQCSATHPLDLLRWYLGNPVDVFAAGNNGLTHPGHLGDGFVAALYRWPGGCIGRVAGTWGCSYHHSYENAYGISLFGTKGTINRGSLILRENDNKPVEIARMKPGHPYEPEVVDFIDAVLTGRKPAVDARDGGNTSIAIIAALDAMDKSGWVTIPNR